MKRDNTVRLRSTRCCLSASEFSACGSGAPKSTISSNLKQGESAFLVTFWAQAKSDLLAVHEVSKYAETSASETHRNLLFKYGTLSTKAELKEFEAGSRPGGRGTFFSQKESTQRKCFSVRLIQSKHKVTTPVNARAKLAPRSNSIARCQAESQRLRPA